MCVTCGCGSRDGVRIEGAQGEHEHILPDGTRVVHSHDHDHEHGHEHHHDHGHDSHASHHAHHHEHSHDHEHHHGDGVRHSHGHRHHHAHAHDHDQHLRGNTGKDTELVHLERSLLDKNQRIAERNRAWLAGRGVLAINLMSSPGAGKTSLLVRTLTDLADELPAAVVEGDQETSADAERIRATGARAVQVNTGAGCHLEADMLEKAITVLAPKHRSLLFVENVGNLVCPALFDLGESNRVVMLSVTEGDDKPLKYPHMFRAADLVILTKTDLLPHVDFDVDVARANALSINPGLHFMQLSSRTGDGLDAWYDWLRTRIASINGN